MKFKTPISFAIIISLFLFSSVGCKKEDKEEVILNKLPTVRFIQPNSNVTIEKDTVLSFVVGPLDEDGSVAWVEFSIDDVLIETSFGPEYKFEWDIKYKEEIGNRIVKATVYDNKGAKSASTLQVTIQDGTSNNPNDYRNKFTGNFEFKIMREIWRFASPTTYDTSYSTGTIEKKSFELNQIIIRYGNDTLYSQGNNYVTNFPTYSISQSGYFSAGQFYTTDSLEFNQSFGNMGGSENRTIVGTRF